MSESKGRNSYVRLIRGKWIEEEMCSNAADTQNTEVLKLDSQRPL